MGAINAIIAILISAYFIWSLISMYKDRPDMFSKENFGKSFHTLGLLGIVLVAIISVVIMMLRG